MARMYIDAASHTVEDERSVVAFHGQNTFHSKQEWVMSPCKAPEPQIERVYVNVSISLDHSRSNRLIVLVMMVVVVVVVVVVM